MRNDIGGNVAGLQSEMENKTYLYVQDKYGNFISQQGLTEQPISYNYPRVAVKSGDRWEGTRGTGQTKQRIHFRIEKLLEFRGHDVAVIAYMYTNDRGGITSVRDWYDATAGKIIKNEMEIMRGSSDGIVDSRVEMHDRSYE